MLSAGKIGLSMWKLSIRSCRHGEGTWCQKMWHGGLGDHHWFWPLQWSGMWRCWRWSHIPSIARPFSTTSAVLLVSPAGFLGIDPWCWAVSVSDYDLVHILRRSHLLLEQFFLLYHLYLRA